MQNPAYLTLSEHHIYHFRWAIPLHLLPDSKRRYVKLSLRTREPREALYLAKVMSYHADDITKQKWIRGMQHQQIRAIVHEYCQRFLDKKKQTILEGELLPPTELAGYQATIDNIATVVGLDDAGYRIDNDSEIAKMLTTMEVDVKHGSQDYERIRKYLNCYNSLFQWCMNEGIINNNPFANIKATVDKKQKGVAIRKPFSGEQVQKIQQAIALEQKHYRYWGTLIGLYTGARLNEVAQINVDDIKQKDGIWYFHMNDDGDSKKLKNAAARRFVPIHEELLKLGIIDEVDPSFISRIKPSIKFLNGANFKS